MLLPSRKTNKPTKRCTWKDGCRKQAMQNARFCQVHLNMTLHAMRQENYLTPLVKTIRWFYRSTIAGGNCHNH